MTISSMGRRSYETSVVLLMCRIPPRSPASSSPALSKPSRLSISAWFSMRSVEEAVPSAIDQSSSPGEDMLS